MKTTNQERWILKDDKKEIEEKKGEYDWLWPRLDDLNMF